MDDLFDENFGVGDKPGGYFKYLQEFFKYPDEFFKSPDGFFNYHEEFVKSPDLFVQSQEDFEKSSDSLNFSYQSFSLIPKRDYNKPDFNFERYPASIFNPKL